MAEVFMNDQLSENYWAYCEGKLYSENK